LQQKKSADGNVVWSLLIQKMTENKTGEETFRDLFFEKLGIKLKLRGVNLIYNYYNKEKDASYNLYYAEVKSLRKLPETAKNNFAWFSFKQVQKLDLSEQSKHDVTVGIRVIDSSIRKSLGQQTIG
jgi:hypothetical protein